jgi:predicted 3-demethylubiquinone-9 3-methyltransferase (glyoxalase superfamily)
MNKITPFLMFESGAGEAMDFYVKLFKNAKIISKITGPNEMTVGTIEIEGQTIHTYDGGPHFKFSEASSFMVSCSSQEEVDYYWNGFIAGGGKESQCGWLSDKWGVSWQIIPTRLMEIVGHPDREKANRGIQAMLQMKKIIIADLEAAFEGK